jgi:CRISPR/Cas system-associated exonuclease Cas4 (RecB family)
MHMTEKDERFKVSWSSLSRFELCRQKDYLVRQHLAVGGRDVRNFLAGTVVDLVQKEWLDNPVGNMLDLVEDQFEKSIANAEEKDTIKWRSKNDKRNIFKSCVDATKQLQPILEARVLPYDYEPAKRFYTPVKIKKLDGQVEEIILRGEFDLLVRDPADGKFIVWDLKTTADNDYWKKTLGQLVFYDLAIISMFGVPPKKTGLIQPLCDEQVKEFVFDNTHRAEMWGRINSMMQAEWAGDHSPKVDNVGCSFCEVAHACAKFQRKLFPVK